MDEFFKEIEENRKNAHLFLKPLALKIQQQDKLINRKEDELEKLEAVKQELLSEFRGYMEMAVITSFTLHDDYKIITDNRRRVKITDYALLLKWLKANKKPAQIIEFFKKTLSVSKVATYLSKEVNSAREKGQQTLTVDGVTIAELQFTRLKTRSKENDRREEKRNE